MGPNHVRTGKGKKGKKETTGKYRKQEPGDRLRSWLGDVGEKGGAEPTSRSNSAYAKAGSGQLGPTARRTQCGWLRGGFYKRPNDATITTMVVSVSEMGEEGGRHTHRSPHLIRYRRGEG